MRTWPRILTLLVLLGLAGCAIVDGDQARICRIALVAIEPAGTRVTVVRTRAADSGVRIDYRAASAAGSSSQRVAHCRFGPGRDLVGIARDGRDLPGATVYLLRHYFIDSPEGVAADPGPSAPDADLVDLPVPLAHALQHLAAGLPGAAIYGLLAAAYGLLFGLVGRINLAFGELAAVGAAATGLVAAALSSGGLTASLTGLAAGIGIGVLASALHGLAAGHAAFALVPAGRAQASLIATVGLSLALSEYLRLAGGAVPDWIPPLGAEPWPIARAGAFVVTLNAAGLVTGALGLAAALGLVILMRQSRFGRSWRAAADDPLAAALCGVDGRRLLGATLLISGALAGLAGALIAIRFGALGFAGGFGLGLKALAAAILGGIGSIPGAFAGGLAIGLAETLWSAYLPIAWRDLAVYIALVGAIVARPNGLFGRARP